MKFVKKYDGCYISVGGKYRIEKYGAMWEIYTQEFGFKKDYLGMRYTLKEAKAFVTSLKG